MKFKQAVLGTADLKGAWRAGLQALRPADKQHVKAENPSRLTGSVDVDATLKKKYANDPRWDYAIGHQLKNRKDEIVYWVEVHPASDGEIKVVVAKLHWLKDWLRDKAPQLHSMRREYIWVSSGKTSFTLTSPQQKQLAVLGLQHKGRIFTIPDNAAA